MTCPRQHPIDRLPAVPALAQRRTARGYSMTEMVWVVAILGILAAIVISQAVSVSDASKLTAATHKLEMLNSALATYAQTGQEITFPADSGSATDETVVVHYLQGRDPTSPQMGSPFISPNYRPAPSSDPADYRLMWTGGQFLLLTPGQSGTGLQVPFDGSDMGAAWIQPAGWKPYGK